MKRQKHQLKCCVKDCHNRLEDPYTYGCAICKKEIEADMEQDKQQEEHRGNTRNNNDR